MKYGEIRKINYNYNRTYIRENGEDMDDWRKYPYTALKSRYYIECSSLLVYILWHTRVHPNQITLLYAFGGLVGGALLSVPAPVAVVAALIYFVFVKSVLDWSDGTLARLRDQKTKEGAILDPWGATVNAVGFFAGYGLYVHNQTDHFVFVQLTVVVLALMAADVIAFARSNYDGKQLNSAISSSTDTMDTVSFGRVKKLYRLAVVLTDARARVVDFMCLIVFVEILTHRTLLSPYLFIGAAFGYSLRFAGGLYVLLKRDYLAKL